MAEYTTEKEFKKAVEHSVGKEITEETWAEVKAEYYYRGTVCNEIDVKEYVDYLLQGSARKSRGELAYEKAWEQANVESRIRASAQEPFVKDIRRRLFGAPALSFRNLTEMVEWIDDLRKEELSDSQAVRTGFLNYFSDDSEYTKCTPTVRGGKLDLVRRATESLSLRICGLREPLALAICACHILADTPLIVPPFFISIQQPSGAIAVRKNFPWIPDEAVRFVNREAKARLKEKGLNTKERNRMAPQQAEAVAFIGEQESKGRSRTAIWLSWDELHPGTYESPKELFRNLKRYSPGSGANPLPTEEEIEASRAYLIELDEKTQRAQNRD